LPLRFDVCTEERWFRLGEAAKRKANTRVRGNSQNGRVATVDDLPGIPKTLSRVGKLLNFPCAITDVSKSQKYALFDCETSHLTWFDTQKLTARSVTVVSIPDDKPVSSIPLPLKQPVVGILCAAEGREYLLLLRDGIILESYLLP
jgi:hypothetical protein